MTDAVVSSIALPLRAYFVCAYHSINDLRERAPTVLLFVGVIGLGPWVLGYKDAAMVLLGGVALLYTFCYFRSHRYICHDTGINASYGLISRHHTRVPWNAIERIEHSNDWASLLFGLTTFSLYTTGSSEPAATVPYLTRAQAEDFERLVRNRCSLAQSSTDQTFGFTLSLAHSLKAACLVRTTRLLSAGFLLYSMVLFSLTQNLDDRLLSGEMVDVLPATYSAGLSPAELLFLAFSALFPIFICAQVARLYWYLPKCLATVVSVAEQALTVEGGFIVRRKTVCPLESIVQVKVTTGTVSRCLGGSAIEVFSLGAAPLTIPFVPRSQIGSFLSAIGYDEGPQAFTAKAAGVSTWRTLLLSLARPIRDPVIAALVLPSGYLAYYAIELGLFAAAYILIQIWRFMRCARHAGLYRQHDATYAFGDYEFQRMVCLVHARRVTSIRASRPLPYRWSDRVLVEVGVGSERYFMERKGFANFASLGFRERVTELRGER